MHRFKFLLNQKFTLEITLAFLQSIEQFLHQTSTIGAFKPENWVMVINKVLGSFMNRLFQEDVLFVLHFLIFNKSFHCMKWKY